MTSYYWGCGAGIFIAFWLRLIFILFRLLVRKRLNKVVMGFYGRLNWIFVVSVLLIVVKFGGYLSESNTNFNWYQYLIPGFISFSYFAISEIWATYKLIDQIRNEQM